MRFTDALLCPYWDSVGKRMVSHKDHFPRNPDRVEAHQKKKRCFVTERLGKRRCGMSILISCKEVGMDCNFVTEGETGQVAMDSLMRHVQAEHTGDWFEIEEIYQAAHEVIRKKAA